MSLNLNITQNNTYINTNNLEFELKTEDIPQTSQALTSAIAQFKLLLPIGNAPVEGKQIANNITSMKDVAQKLQTAKDNITKDKIKGMMRCALYIAIATVGVLGCIAFPTGAVIIGFGLFIGLYAIACYYAHRWGVNSHGEDYSAPIWKTIAAPYFALTEASKKMSRLEESVNKQRQDVEPKIAEAINFFNQDFTPFKETLAQEIDDIDTSLKMMATMPSASLAGQKDLQDKKERYKLALEELEKGITFYEQFQPQTLTAKLAIPSAPPAE